MPPIASRIPPFQVAELKRATEIYLRHAYPTGVIPAVIQRRLDWPANADARTLLSQPYFEPAISRASLDDPIRLRHDSDTQADRVYCLRLGNSRYPHMKLQVQAFENRAGYMLSVNTHDQISVSSDSVDYERFREIQRENQRLKLAIEAEWRSAGFPTFNAYLEEVALAQQGSGDKIAACVC